MVSKNKADREIKRLKARLSRYGYIVRGTIVKRYQRCGKSNCRCQKDIRKRHGPYYYYTRKKKGKTVGKVYARKKAEDILRYISAYNAVVRIIRRISELSECLILEEQRNGRSRGNRGK